MRVEFPRRRIFLAVGEEAYQILDFTQARNDSSIYISFPDSLRLKWLALPPEDGTPRLRIIETPSGCKLSIHGSGMAKIAPNIHELVVHGSILLDRSKKMIGARHLFTAQLAKPFVLPRSPALERKGDYVIKTGALAPFVVIFFAIPRVKTLTRAIQIRLCTNDLETVPPSSGGGTFELVLHQVFWLAYRTKHMEEWPESTHVCYHDGCVAPVLIGEGGRMVRMELRTPVYEVSEAQVSVKL